MFAGYGLQIPEAHHDDFAGLDVRGKLVVFLSGAPPAIRAAGRTTCSRAPSGPAS